MDLLSGRSYRLPGSSMDSRRMSSARGMGTSCSALCHYRLSISTGCISWSFDEMVDPYKQGVVIGFILVVQYLISSEIVATLLLMSLIGAVIYLVADRRSITVDAAQYMAKGLAGAVTVLVICLLYPLWYTLFGREHFGARRSVKNPYHGVLLGPIVPTGAQHFSPPGLSRYHGVLDPLTTQYLGAPLVVLVALLCVWFRRNRGLLLAVSLSVISFVLSLGLHLVVLSRSGSIPLPYVAISQVPWLNNILPERLSLYVALFVAIAVGLDLIRPDRIDII